jgi:AraC-binding-like domain
VPVTLSHSASQVSGEAFVGDVAASRIGPLGIVSITSQAQTVGRTSAGFLNMPLREASTVTQDDRRAELGPGHFVVVDATWGFALDFTEEFEQLSLILPPEMLLPLLANSDVPTAQTVSGDAGLGALAAGALRPLFEGVGIDGRLAQRPPRPVLSGARLPPPLRGQPRPAPPWRLAPVCFRGAARRLIASTSRAPPASTARLAFRPPPDCASAALPTPFSFTATVAL